MINWLPKVITLVAGLAPNVVLAQERVNDHKNTIQLTDNLAKVCTSTKKDEFLACGDAVMDNTHGLTNAFTQFVALETNASEARQLTTTIDQSCSIPFEKIRTDINAGKYDQTSELRIETQFTAAHSCITAVQSAAASINVDYMPGAFGVLKDFVESGFEGEAPDFKMLGMEL